MSTEWTNLQILECEAGDGSFLTVIKQSNGSVSRYVLGNGTPVSPNPDGTFQTSGASDVLNVVGF